ncbi:MAG: radical SAM peptide maturase, CXXX-repeat target family [Oscillospiraceae bacterium]|nr:radical SAM peptide maturase, CXXX-repeat target family [Oscillospiraceae bacterium]
MQTIKSKIRFGKLAPSFEEGKANNITFCVTEECNLRCKYCYLIHKNNFKKMNFETAKKAVDYFLSARDIYNEKSVVWDFIGGEPFLEIELIDKICDYIKEQMYLTKHPWFDNYMFSFSSNGLLYSTKEVQDYIKKNNRHISIGISVDGNKIKHDLQRVYPDGSGSYDDVVKNVPLWLEQFKEMASTKATFSHDDLPYLKDSIIHLWNLGIKEVAANVIFENVWDEKDPEIFENQLKELADYVIEHEIWKDPAYTVRFFDPATGLPMSPNRNKNKFCGSGKMVAIDCDGNLFPCIRFSQFSLEKQKAFATGNVEQGIIKDRLKPFKYLSIEKVNDEECKNCKVASGCMTCTGFCYDDSSSGSIFKRAKYICEMQKANVRAIDYFWDRVKEQLGGGLTPRDEERQSHEKSFNKYLAIYLSDSEMPHCRYSNKLKTTDKPKKIPEQTIEEALTFAKENMFTPIFIGLPPEKFKDYNSVVPAKDAIQSNNELVVYNGTVEEYKKSIINILHVYKNTLSNLYENVKKLFENNKAVRVNIILNGIEEFNETDLKVYEQQLELVAEYILNSKRPIQINVLNGLNSEIDSVNGSGCGVRTFAVMPNGKLYACPGFYFEDENKAIGDLKNGFTFDYQNELDISFSKDCINCQNFHCDHCIYVNKKTTNEYSISPDIQCKISDIEHKIGDKLIKNLKIKRAKEEEAMNNL